jgi:ferritin-like metal-binding protein YciE
MMQMAVQSMEDLFLETLKDVYHAEKQVLKALPKMAKKAGSDELRQAFETHRTETEGQVERIEQVFELLGKKARGKPCAAMEGLVEEGKEIMEEVEDEQVLDAGLISAAQAIEHYEIARYGTLIAWAKRLGMDEAAGLLQQTLDEEGKTDKLLSKLAVSNINQKAA